MKKYLVDTCGWIEWLQGSPLSTHYEPYLKQLSHLIVPTLVQMELYKWVSREKDLSSALEVIAVTERAVVIPLDTPLALLAGHVSKAHQLATADAIVYATAQNADATLITSDKHFSALPNVKYIPKKE